jgi:hypothetical protein
VLVSAEDGALVAPLSLAAAPLDVAGDSESSTQLSFCPSTSQRRTQADVYTK